MPLSVLHPDFLLVYDILCVSVFNPRHGRMEGRVVQTNSDFPIFNAFILLSFGRVFLSEVYSYSIRFSFLRKIRIGMFRIRFWAPMPFKWYQNTSGYANEYVFLFMFFSINRIILTFAIPLSNTNLLLVYLTGKSDDAQFYTFEKNLMEKIAYLF